MGTWTPVKLMICKPRVALARLHVPLGRWAMPVGTGTLDMMHSKSVPLAYCRIQKKYVQNTYIYMHIHTHTSVYIHMTTLQVFLILLLFVSVLNWGGQFTPTGHMSKGLCTWVLLTVNIFWKCRWIGCYCLFRRGEYCMTDNFSIERAVAFNTPYPCNIIMCRSLCNVVVLLLFIFVLSNLMWSIIWS